MAGISFATRKNKAHPEMGQSRSCRCQHGLASVPKTVKGGIEMAVYLQDCNRNPIKDPNYILVTPNVMTSQAYRIILEEMEKRKKEQEAAS